GEPAGRLDHELERDGARGTGLGLPVSQKILREHGGDILVESTLGTGSRFILELPAIIPDPSNHSDTLAGFRIE
ncbi:MAG TPA: ATP-binding protein, partial [Pirellulaceae bacterium]|nr:ATP-binding protein [Pirellulaceae bacterium]